MSKQDIKEKILADIKKSGFITEMKASSILLKSNWTNTLNGETFYDKDLDKSREIDIITSKTEHSEDSRVNVTVHLIIEVKKSEKPWIIFCHKRSSRKHEYLGWGILNFRDNFPRNKLLSKTINSQNRYATSNLYGTAYTEAFKNTSETSQIYQALLSCCKASVHLKDSISYEVDPFDPLNDYDIDFFLPITLLDGVLFQATLDDDGEVELQEVNYCPIQLNYSSQKYSERIFYPEILTLNDFENHLKHIETWQKHIVDSVVKKIV